MIDVQNSGLPVWARIPFANQAEIADAMSDPRYRDPLRGDDFRKAVESKLALDGSAQAGFIAHAEQRNFVHVSTAISDAPPGVLTPDDVKAANEQARAEWGEHAFGPGSARITAQPTE